MTFATVLFLGARGRSPDSHRALAAWLLPVAQLKNITEAGKIECMHLSFVLGPAVIDQIRLFHKYALAGRAHHLLQDLSGRHYSVGGCRALAAWLLPAAQLANITEAGKIECMHLSFVLGPAVIFEILLGHEVALAGRAHHLLQDLSGRHNSVRGCRALAAWLLPVAQLKNITEAGKIECMHLSFVLGPAVMF